MTNLTHGRRTTRLLAALGCMLILASLILPASAAEGTIDCTYLTITGDGFVADTMDGVEARYNLYGPTLYCVELITRYYAEVYGLEIRCSGGAPAVLNNPDLYFEKTDNPQPGDVMYGSAAARGKGYNHWALVKSNNGASLTLFEQNWRWNGQAGVNRVIEYPTACYEIYTLKSGLQGVDLIAGSGVLDDAVDARLAVPPPVLLKEGKACAVVTLDQSPVVVAFAPGRGAAVHHIAGLGIVGLFKVEVRIVEHRGRAAAAADLQAVDLRVIAGDQLHAVERGPIEVVAGFNAVHRVGHKAVAGDCQVCTVDGPLRRRGRQDQRGQNQHAAKGCQQSCCASSMGQIGHPFLRT